MYKIRVCFKAAPENEYSFKEPQNIYYDYLITCTLILFRFETSDDPEKELAFDQNFGRSLMAGYTDHYMSDFALHGTSDTNYMGRLHNDLTTAVQVLPSPSIQEDLFGVH